MRSLSGWALVTCCALTVPGCAQHNRRTVEDPDAPRGTYADGRERRIEDRTNKSAVRAISTARCDRESRCKNLGADAKYASKEDCLDRVRADWSNELSVYECPNGLVGAELDECLDDIRNEDCGNPFDTLARTMSCSKSEICAKD
ncbi:MAG: DUF6184 family natural product biosynthesis lipoprotein [Polyangiales bacterium]